MYIKIIRAVYEKPIANIIPNVKQQKPFPLKSGTRQECPLSSLLFNIVMGFLARALRKEEEIKGIQIGKEEEVKPSPFADEVIKYLKEPKMLIKTVTKHKLFWQSTKVQNYHAKISSLLIPQQ
jgi:hypothetical protein